MVRSDNFIKNVKPRKNSYYHQTMVDPKKPEFARYIEVKSTKRVTVPSFDKNWGDALNITAKEWVAAEQYGEYYNIYRVYFTKTKTIVVRIKK